LLIPVALSSCSGSRVSLFLQLHQATSTLLEEKILLLGYFRVRVQNRQQVTIALHQLGSNGTKFHVVIQAVEDGLTGQGTVFYDLSIVGRFLGHPQLQLY
jgi:hypothetical protein